ncbi:MAG: NAD-dependent epimerase/dehydratase family protein [Phycisphaera sp.]|nr:NAD-dependent epimerase/dehydratase family protein [Phycisphaera sp.]
MVIGSNCFTGSHIVEGLLRSGVGHVVGVSRSAEADALFLPYKALETGGFEFIQIDIRVAFDKLREQLDRIQPRVVIHVAALSEVGLSNHSPVEYFEVNTLAVVKLCDYLRRQSWLKRYVHISSAEMLGTCRGAVDESALFNPSTPYAVSKAAADMFINTLIANFNYPATLIRSTNVYGKHQQLFKIIPRTAIYIKLGKTVELHGGGLSRKSFIHIRDVVDCVLRAIERGAGGTYHLSVPSDDTVADVVATVCRKMGKNPESCTKVVGERLGQDGRYWLDCAKARKDLGWEPRVLFDTGVGEVVEWVESNWVVIRKLPLEYVHKV